MGLGPQRLVMIIVPSNWLQAAIEGDAVLATSAAKYMEEHPPEEWRSAPVRVGGTELAVLCVPPARGLAQVHGAVHVC
eukprot:3814928-Pyramimonas_sp.AAC.1